LFWRWFVVDVSGLIRLSLFAWLLLFVCYVIVGSFFDSVFDVVLMLSFSTLLFDRWCFVLSLFAVASRLFVGWLLFHGYLLVGCCFTVICWLIAD
jgi:hypothetical protein